MADPARETLTDQQEEQDSVPLIYDEIRWAIGLQREALDALQSKAATLLGFSGAILALLFGSLTDQTLTAPIRISVFVGVVLSLVAILMASTVLWARRMRTDPSPQVLLERFYDKALPDTQLQVAVNRVDAFKENSRRVERMALVLRLAMLAQTAAVAALGVAIARLVIGV